jgi:hypothetical protein
LIYIKKSESIERFKEFRSEVEKEKNIIILWSNYSGEYSS